MRLRTAGSALALAAAALASPTLGSTIGIFLKRAVPQPDPVRAAAVVDAFRIAWKGYREHAFPHDTLRPISLTSADDRNAWGVTPVDALSTAIILGEARTVHQILEYVATIDFTTTKEANSSISLFETNIRYLGGLLAGYDLLKGPKQNLVDSTSRVDTLLEQAKTLADSLSIAFDTPSGVPDDTVFLNPKRRIGGSEKNGPAGAGTLVLEWTRLSDLSGNKTYAKLAQKAQDYLVRPRGKPEPFPGLVGYDVSIANGSFLDQSGGWGAGMDSFYEYLIKMYLYDPKEFSFYKDRWVAAAESTIKYLASHPTTRKDLTFIGGYQGTKIFPNSGHLASFAGGNFILAGVVLQEPKYTKFGLELAESYYQTYAQTASGVGPEVFSWVATDGDGGPPAGAADFYKKSGFWVNAGGYILRPETIESLYYAYRVTGDKKYQNMAWKAFTAIRDRCRAGAGFAGLNDVTKADGGSKIDFMESFFLAEALKYSYLMFADESDVHFQGQKKNSFVFNTEAHPFRVRS